MEFCKNIKNLRLEHNLLQKNLALKLNSTTQQISKLETGAIEPNLAMLIKMADFFGVTTDYLIGRENEAGIIEISEYSIIHEKSQV